MDAIQQLWNGILDFLSAFVTPDWASLIGLLPLAVAAAGVLLLGGLVLAYVLLASPTRRGRRPLPPLPPPGVHEGEPSLAPIFVAVGAAVLFFGIVFRGPVLAAGILLTVAALLYWGREAVRDYRRLESHDLAVDAGATTLRPIQSLGGPPLPRLRAPAPPSDAATEAGAHALPPGIHAPAPSFRPLLVSLAAAVLFFGLVFGPAILAAGVVMLFITLAGWLADARAEYRATVRADATGHVEPLPAPGLPVGTLVLFAVVLAIGIAARTGIFTPTSGQAPAASAGAVAAATAGTTPGAGVSGAGGGPAASAGGGAASGALAVTAQGIAFKEKSLSAAGNKSFTIAFTNSDPGIPHDIVIHQGSASGQAVFEGTPISGPATTTYTVPALAPGTYTFICSIHPQTMQGTLTVR